jgi:hypothetical protein
LPVDPVDHGWSQGIMKTVAATRFALRAVERAGGDVEAERRWQWLRLLAYMLEPVEVIEARIATLKPSDKAGYAREVCRMIAVARHEEDAAAEDRANLLAGDARFLQGWKKGEL